MSRNNWTTLVLLMIVVFLIISTPIFISTLNDRTQLAVTCTSARSNIEQLTALNEIADRLGIPHDFVVPEIPPECVP